MTSFVGPEPGTVRRHPRWGESESLYIYEDAGGPVLEVARFPMKRFMQRDPRNPEDRWGLRPDTPRPLFRLPQLLDHLAADSRVPIFVVEGEKDVLAIENAGGVATTNPMGSGKWLAGHAETLAPARRVVVVVDRDDDAKRDSSGLTPGEKHAKAIVDSLGAIGFAGALELVQAAEGKDAADHLAAGLGLDDFAPFEFPEPESASLELRVVTFEQFASADEASAEPLLGTVDENLLPAGGLALLFGEAGSGKTSLAIDAALHLAAGAPWLEIPVARAARVLLIENEGPRGPFRKKLERKQAAWQGDPFAQNVVVLEEPWARVDLRDATIRAQLADAIATHRIDLIVLGPLSRSGTEGGGTPDEVNAFEALRVDVASRAPRPLAWVLIHHTNKGGSVSGAWEPLPDLLVHVKLDERDRSLFKIDKARWAPGWHGSRLTLAWRDGERYDVVDRDGTNDAAAKADEEIAAAEWLLEHVANHHAETGKGVARGRLEEAFHQAHGGRGRNLARRVVGLFLTEGTGEHFEGLATGPGEAKNGVYLYPAWIDSSPLAAPLFGEGGEPLVEPPEDGPLASSPPPYRRAASGEHSGEGDLHELEALAERHADLVGDAP